MRESELEKKFCKLVAQAGGKAYKFVSPGNAGVPDRIVVLPGGKIGFVELKKQGGTPRKQQWIRRAELESLGCYAAVVDSVESAETAISAIRIWAPQAQCTDRLSSETMGYSSGRKGVAL